MDRDDLCAKLSRNTLILAGAISLSSGLAAASNSCRNAATPFSVNQKTLLLRDGVTASDTHCSISGAKAQLSMVFSNGGPFLSAALGTMTSTDQYTNSHSVSGDWSNTVNNNTMTS